MLADWSAECGTDDPVLVIPWADPGNPSIHFIDLRENPYDLDHLPEAAEHPPLLHALRSLNAARSPFFTAKCDAWPVIVSGPDDTYAQSELAYLHLNLHQTADETPVGFASYVDLLSRDRTLFASRHRHEQLLDRITHRTAALDHPYAMLELVLRPALVDLSGPQEGYSISLYIKALGHEPESAEEHWGQALADVTALLRGKAFALP